MMNVSSRIDFVWKTLYKIKMTIPREKMSLEKVA